MTALSRSQQIDWLRLARADNVGPVTFAYLLKRYGTAGRALAALPDLAQRAMAARPASPARRGRVERELADGEAAAGARLILMGDHGLSGVLLNQAEPRSTRRRPCCG